MKCLLPLVTLVACAMALPASLAPEMSLHARKGDPSWWDTTDISEKLKANYREHSDQDQENMDKAMACIADKKNRKPENYEQAKKTFADLTTNNPITRGILMVQLSSHTKDPEDLFEELLGNSVRSRKPGS